MSTPTTSPTRFLDVSGGRLAYDDTGTGPLLVCVPGIGDLRAAYRFLTPRLVAAGYRVVTLDLRGHGESSVGWPDYREAAIAADVLALVQALDVGPAILLGNSYGGGAVAYAAGTTPSAVAGLVLYDAFVRDHPQSFGQRLGISAVSLLGPGAWSSYYRSLYPSTPPDDLTTYRAALTANLQQRGRFAATKAMMHASHAAVTPLLAQIQAPTLVVVGTKDPDFADPAAEARYIAEQLRQSPHVEVALIDGAGHYPYAEKPEETATVTLAFLRNFQGALHGA